MEMLHLEWTLGAPARVLHLRALREQTGVTMRGRIAAANSAGYGQGIVVLKDGDGVAKELQAEAIVERLVATFRSPGYTPPLLPAAAIEVHRLSQLPDVQVDQIIKALELDPLLAARVLRVASSAVYGGHTVPSLHSGVTRLGLRQLSAVVWEVALNMRVFRCKAYQAPMEKVRRHSVAVAHVARAVAKATSIPLEYAFLCGLLHDVGAAAALLLLGEGGSNTQEGAVGPELLRDVLGGAHAEASQLVAKLWGLPDDLQLALGHHHQVSCGGFAHPTAAVIAIAEQLLAEHGEDAGMPWEETPHGSLVAARDALQLSTSACERVRAEAESILARLGQET